MGISFICIYIFIFRNGNITFQAKELVKQDSYGPDNVPITAIKK